MRKLHDMQRKLPDPRIMLFGERSGMVCGSRYHDGYASERTETDHPQCLHGLVMELFPGIHISYEATCLCGTCFPRNDPRLMLVHKFLVLEPRTALTETICQNCQEGVHPVVGEGIINWPHNPIIGTDADGANIVEQEPDDADEPFEDEEGEGT